MNRSEYDLLGRAMIAAICEMERHAALLDRINVFPVVDADTGTNLAQTFGRLRPVIEENAALNRSPAESIDQLKDTLLRSARGNSGVILAQFVVAFLDTIRNKPALDFDVFSQAAENGAVAAFAAVAEPAEGTMLTVMREVAGALKETGSMETVDDHAVFEKFTAEQVAKTRQQMPRLDQAGVVDSGALGFHIYISGLALLLPALAGNSPAEGRLAERKDGINSTDLGPISRSIRPEFLERTAEDKPDLRFCINVLLEPKTPLTRKSLAEQLQAVASSVDVATTGNRAKIHLHSNRPQSVKKHLLTVGPILDFQAEDMTVGLFKARSQAMNENSGDISTRHLDFRVVSDSSLSLSRDLAESHGILRMENYVHIHSQMVSDSLLEQDELFHKLRSGFPIKTAQTSPAEARQFFEHALQLSDNILYVAVGNAYTGTQKMARRVIGQLPQKERITVVDSHAASGQQGLVCLAAARQARANLTSTELVQYVEQQIELCREYLVIDNLQYLRRSGRIGRIKATLADMFSVKPIVGHGLDGAITYGKVRSHEAAICNIIERVATHPGKGALITMIEYTDNLDWIMSHVVPQMEASLPAKTEYVLSPLSSTSAVHMGPGTWGVAVTRI